ncbi:GAF domain-containing sensor histidine kinase [Pontibacter akesuensis]|uniref:histidine kinase n=2 Tax=Pontibacter akesuensis TaxID=388950 RepID=A0A1I7KMG8_9BACT|nr:GAF domain-containing sensor histidine kinase [Pontibacter akesuensis]GHA77588.1 sensor histidine kinase [Pontibacter akesuensis]SFU98605.1 GAF sensor signal transduction histidine kinase [Pontibacter akesuensis]
MIADKFEIRQEQERLEALRNYEVLDTPAEVDFDELTSLASQICGTPISLISLIDEDRQWFKSSVGLTVPETPRRFSFCHHAIQYDTVFEVQNTLEDKRFNTNPFVTGEPKVRFYAGSPLISSSGHKLGTLCVIDTIPRRLTPEQKYALEILSKQVIANMELRRERRRLLLEKQQLQEANEKLDQFVSMVSHDLKEPIMNMQALIEWLQEDMQVKDYANLASNLHLLKERAATMENLVYGLLEYSLVHVQDMPREQVDVRKMVEQITTSLNSTNNFKVTLSPDLPSFETERILLQQVFTNILSNAFKFHHTGKGHIRVGVQEENDEKYTFYVQDDGPGIAPQHHERIFGMYERLIRDSSKVKGSGIGLATVKKIVQDKGGQIWIDSDLGKGTTFYFTWAK